MRWLLRALLRPVFDRLEARVGPVDRRVTDLEARVERIDAAAPVQPSSDDVLGQWIDDRFRCELAGGATFYEPLAGLLEAAHEYRMELLGGLALPPLDDAVCLDYGVGSWGFAAVYPRLHGCRFAIGIDISSAAIAESERVSAAGVYPYGDRFQYLTSRGESLPLPDGTVDVVFSGESIEHVDATVAFVDELHRVMRPGGHLVVTTPNADAELYRRRGERYCVGPEHTALMGYDELVALLSERFALVEAYGYCASRYPDIDAMVGTTDDARAAVRTHTARPDLASNLVCLFRRRDDRPAPRHRVRSFDATAPEVRRFGRWSTATLSGPLAGLLTEGAVGDCLEVECEGTTAIAILWAQPWGGRAVVEVGAHREEVDLYEPVGGFRRVLVTGLEPGVHRLRVTATGTADPRSAATQVIVFRLIADLALASDAQGA